VKSRRAIACTATGATVRAGAQRLEQLKAGVWIAGACLCWTLVYGRTMRFLEVLPIGLLRDEATGGEQMRCTCTIRMGNGGAAPAAVTCPLGGDPATSRRTAGGKLWPGSVLIELPKDSLSTPASRDNIVVDVGFTQPSGGDVRVGSTTLPLRDTIAKVAHSRWLEPATRSSATSTRPNLLQLKARLHDDLTVDINCRDAPGGHPRVKRHAAVPAESSQPQPQLQGSVRGDDRKPRQPGPSHPRVPPVPIGLLRAPRGGSRVGGSSKAGGGPLVEGPTAAATSLQQARLSVSTDATKLAPTRIIVELHITVQPQNVQTGADSAISRIRAKFYGSPSIHDLTDSLREVLLLGSDTPLELVDPHSNREVDPISLSSGSVVRLRRPRGRSVYHRWPVLCDLHALTLVGWCGYAGCGCSLIVPLTKW
jgi:hypothetical protein